MPPTKKELILAAVALLAIPLLAEVGLRMAAVRFDPQLYAPSRERGWTLRPGAEGIVSGETKQFVRINHLGFRDRDRSYAKPGDTLRIALLGNSWTEALQVPLEKTYGSVLEQKLAEANCFSGKRVEVLNFGVAGYSTAQELLLLQQEVWKYHPDIVMLAFYSARDVSNNLRALNNTVNPDQSPYFVFAGDQLVLDSSFRSLPSLQWQQIQLQNVRTHISEQSRTLQAVGSLQRSINTRIALAAAHERAEKVGFDNLEYSIYAPPTQSAMSEAWRITEGLLLAIRDEVNSRGATFWIVTLANRPQVIPDPAKRQQLANKLGVADLSYADNRISEFAHRAGIPVTTLAPALAKFADAHHVYLNGFNTTNFGSGHWNESGHRLAAEVIAEDLCSGAEDRLTQARNSSP
jgi:hypothetical protein